MMVEEAENGDHSTKNSRYVQYMQIVVASGFTGQFVPLDRDAYREVFGSG